VSISLEPHLGLHVDADPLAFGVDLSNRVGIHRGSNRGKHFENSDLDTGACVDVPEFERDDAAADENHLARQLTLIQDLIRCDHVLGPRERQRTGLRPGRDNDVASLDHAIAHAGGVGTGEDRLAANDLDTALRHQAPERAGDVADHLLLAVDEGGPIEPRLADGNAMDPRPLDLVQCVTRATSTFFGVQPRFGQVPPRSRASTIATERPAARVATVTPMPHCRRPGSARHIFPCASICPPSSGKLIAGAHLQTVDYFAFTLDVMDPITVEAILN